VTIFKNSAEGGAPGVAVTANNSGGNSGDAWSDVSTGTGAQMLYASDSTAHGARSYRFEPPSGSTSGFAYGTVSFAATNQASASVYVRPGPVGSQRAIIAFRSSSATATQVRLTATNAIQILNAAGSQVFLSSATLTPYKWYRIDIRCVRGTTSSNGTIQFAYYTQETPGTAVQTSSSSSLNTGTADLVGVRLGHNVVGLTGTFTPLWMDSIQVASAADAGALLGNWTPGGVRVWSPSTDQILNLDGVRRRIDRFRFELCDKELNPIGELHPDRSSSVPSIAMDASQQSPSRRLSSLTLTPDEAADVDPISDRLRVYMTLQNGAEYRLGTFMFTDDNRPQRAWGSQANFELVDFSFILEQQSTKAYSWGKGGTITLIMFFLLFQAGFKLEQIKVIGEEANRGLADAVAWQPGSTWMQMLTDLGALVGFGPPWFDRDGNIFIDHVPDPSLVQPTVPAYGPGTRVIADSIVMTNDLLAAPNDFAVYDSGTDRLRVGRYELPASAPHSYQRRGFRVGMAESAQGGETQAQLNAAAAKLARRTDVFKTVTFNSTIDPRHDVYDVYDFEAEDGIDRVLEVAWNMELRSGGQMQHTARTVHYDVV
jgi:hypothetical protein